MPKSSVGIALGCYAYPKLAEVQINLIRFHCGDIPILISDDCTPGYADQQPFTDFVRISKTYRNVFLWSNPIRLGHGGGDLTAFYAGIFWAKMNNLKWVVKLSQRFMFDMHNWADRWVSEVEGTGFNLSTQPCLQGKHDFKMRTEACLLRVEPWYDAEVLNSIYPFAMNSDQVLEYFFLDMYTKHFGSNFHHTSLFGPQRYHKNPDTLWHCSSTKTEYQEVASRFGLTLDPHFDCEGWQHWKDYLR